MAPNKTTGRPYKDWLYAVPLLHQLKYKEGITHDVVSFEVNEPDWGIDGLNHDYLAQFKDFVQKEKYVSLSIVLV